jgi:hypothetical protein
MKSTKIPVTVDLKEFFFRSRLRNCFPGNGLATFGEYRMKTAASLRRCGARNIELQRETNGGELLSNRIEYEFCAGKRPYTSCSGRAGFGCRISKGSEWLIEAEKGEVEKLKF